MILIQVVFLAGEILFISQKGKLGPAKHLHLDFSINIKAILYIVVSDYIYKNMYLVTASMLFFF